MIIPIFLKWFFFSAPKEILAIGGNFVAWGWHFFSIGYLPRYLFSPWHRDITPYGRGFDLKRIFHVLGWNLISRVIGAIMRVFVIGIGLAAELLILVLAVFFFLFWFVLPVFSLVLIIFGIITILA